ncbi:hypothetical protein FRB90_009846, partial [Tulasnella sp. 427]
ELVFAKTSNGIYCMACHNERVARSRRHADRKRDKSRSSRKDKDAGGSTNNNKDRERRPKDVPVSLSLCAPLAIQFTNVIASGPKANA